MTRILDVSLPIGPGLLVWPDNPGVEAVPRLRIAAGDAANVSELRLGTHTGTHVDPPLHFVEGAAGIDAVPLDLLVGEAFVAEVRDADGPIGPAELDALSLPADAVRLLLKTPNSALWRSQPVAFPDRYACLSPEGAKWIVERGIRLVGIDFLSIEQRGAAGHPVHAALLGNGVVIVEGLDLWEAPAGRHTLVCLPLRIAGGDGGPARALLVAGEETGVRT